MDIAIMIEGQNGLTWARWMKIAALVEEMGFAGLYRSDHFTNMNPPDVDSLEMWTSLTWLASHTQRIEFGPLVSPVSFRHPALTARMATAVDDLSGGRLTLGLGAGWQEREHKLFGFDLLSIKDRFERFDEGLQVITGLLNSDQPISFKGKYYTLDEAIMLPRPQRKGGAKILIGGNGEKLTLPLVVKYASEWNCVFLKPQEIEAKNKTLDTMLIEAGRKPGEVRRSMMAGLRYARTQRELDDQLVKKNQDAGTLRGRGVIVAAGQGIVAALKELESAGLDRVMLQWLDLDDLDGLKALGETVKNF